MIKRQLYLLLILSFIMSLCTAAIAEEPLFGSDFHLIDACLPSEGARETLLAEGIVGEGTESTVAILALDNKGESLWRVTAQGAMEGESIYSFVPLPDSVGVITGRESDPQWMNIVKNGTQTYRWMLPAVTSDVFHVGDGLLVFYRESDRPHSPRSIALYDIEGNQLWEKSHNLNWYIDGALETAEGYVAWGYYSEEVNADALGYVVILGKTGEVLWQCKTEKIPSLKFAFPQADGSVVIAGNHLFSDDRPSVARFAKLSRDGILWEREQSYGTEEELVNGLMWSIVAAGGDYYVASAEAGIGHGIRMWVLDAECNLICSWVEETPEAYRPTRMLLIPQEDGLKLLYHGFREQDYSAEDAQLTYWKDVERVP